jgi:hypothetical protein
VNEVVLREVTTQINNKRGVVGLLCTLLSNAPEVTGRLIGVALVK